MVNILKKSNAYKIYEANIKIKVSRSFDSAHIKILFIIMLVVSYLCITPNIAYAACRPVPCSGCAAVDTTAAINLSNTQEDTLWQPLIETDIEHHLNSEENWIVEDFFEDFWVKGLAELTEFLGTFGMYQVETIGMFFDAKNELETRRLYFKLQAEAHTDYHPSDDFCWFGTNSRSLAASESRANLNMLAMSSKAIQRRLGHKNFSSTVSRDRDKDSRWAQFIKTYCDPKDNAWSINGTGLDLACDRDGNGASTATGAVDLNRVNRDIDYTRLIDEPRTLNVNFSATTGFPSEDDEDVMAMAANLYGNNVHIRKPSYKLMKNPVANKLYMDLRSVEAKRNVAENSFNAIVSMKSAGTTGIGTFLRPGTGSFMASLIKELMPRDTPNDDIIKILGEYPSYYAQLEFLSKKIYQNTDFFVNLYDTPANIKRKKAAMKAISLMLDRALYESEIRQEMLLSVMLSSKLNDNYRVINHDLKQKKKKK